MADILNKFLAKATLLSEDRKTLQEKRGLTNEIIDSAQLVSARPENKELILDLTKEFGREFAVSFDLVKVRVDGVVVNEKFLTPNIIIPYLDEDGDCSVLRPHKYFPAGRSLQVYYANAIYDPNIPTVFTEGEFKALAAVAYGFQAFSVPGITAFLGDKEAGKRFVEFYEELEIKKIHDVVTLFDNEEKGDPKLPKFKDDVKKRYDVQYFAYIMSKKINDYQAVITARIGWIPDKYRDSSGKADIDGMRAAGVSQKEFEDIISSSVTPEQFYEKLPEEAFSVVSEKLTKREEKIKIFPRNGIYVYMSENDKGELSEKDVSNFILTYVATYLDENEKCEYEFTIKNNESYTNTIRFNGEDVSAVKSFRATLASKGKFIWSGSVQALDALFSSIVPKEPKIILVRNRIGWDDDLQCFIFDNCIVSPEGATFNLPEDRIITYNGNNIKVDIFGGRPELHFNIDNKKITLERIRLIASKLRDNFNFNDINLAFAWFIGCAYKPWLFPINRTFPILFIFGQKGSGKTRLIQWLMRLFFSDEKVDVLFESSTKASLRNRFDSMPYLPVWLEEFRNDRKGRTYLDMFRGIYDHSQIIMSASKYGENTIFKLKSCLVISGEHIPDDETGAINQRMITIQIPNAETYQSLEQSKVFEWIELEQYTFSSIFTFLLENREKFVPAIISEYSQILETYRSRKDIHQRVAINYSLLHAISKVILGVSPHKDSEEKVFEEIRKDDADQDTATEFISAIINISKIRDYQAIKNYIDIKKSADGKIVLLFNLYQCYYSYAEWRRRTGGDVMNKSQLRKIISSKKWVSDMSKVCRLKSTLTRCTEAIVELMPENLVLDIYSIAESPEKELMKSVFGGEQGILVED